MNTLTEDSDAKMIEESIGTNTLRAPSGFDEFYSDMKTAHQGIKYTLQLYHAVQQARKEYKHFKDGNAIGLQAFVKNIN